MAANYASFMRPGHAGLLAAALWRQCVAGLLVVFGGMEIAENLSG
jgi:hypothetical protein